MAAWIIFATGAAGVPFYLTFLVALFKECRYVRICYLVRIQPDTEEIAIVEPSRDSKSFARAA
jgi:hypothetical protein